MWKKIIQNNGSNITNTDAIVRNFIDSGLNYNTSNCHKNFESTV